MSEKTPAPVRKRLKKSEQHADTSQSLSTLKQLYENAARTDSLVEELLDASEKCFKLHGNARNRAATNSAMIETCNSCLSDVYRFRISLVEKKKQLCKLQGIHSICLNEVHSDRAKRFERRHLASQSEVQLKFEKQIEQVNKIMVQTNKLCNHYEDELKRWSEYQKFLMSFRRELMKSLTCVEEQISELIAIHDKCPSRVSAEVLPESVLLHIFQYLPPKVLIHNVGLVCKTWRRVSKDFLLWRNEKVVLNLQTSSSFPTACYLQVAPCLKSLTLCFSEFTPSKSVKLLLRSQCLLSKLKIVEANTVQLGLIVGFMKRQSLSLTELILEDCHVRSSHTVNLLWCAVASMKKLKILTAQNCDSLFLSTCKIKEFSSPLEVINIRSCRILPKGSLAWLVKSSHSSLTMLELPGDISRQAMKELSLKNCKSLKVLQAPCLPELSEIGNCSQLEDLRICNRNSPPSTYVCRVVEFLKSSDQVKNLKSFEVNFPTGTGCDKLSQAICNMPNLKTLVLKGNSAYPVDNILSLLRGVPLLEELNAYCFPLCRSDIAVFSTGILPALKVLQIPYEFTLYGNYHHSVHTLTFKRQGLILKGLVSQTCYCLECSSDSEDFFDSSSDDSDMLMF